MSLHTCANASPHLLSSWSLFQRHRLCVATGSQLHHLGRLGLTKLCRPRPHIEQRPGQPTANVSGQTAARHLHPQPRCGTEGKRHATRCSPPRLHLRPGCWSSCEKTVVLLIGKIGTSGFKTETESIQLPCFYQWLSAPRFESDVVWTLTCSNKQTTHPAQ